MKHDGECKRCSKGRLSLNIGIEESAITIIIILTI